MSKFSRLIIGLKKLTRNILTKISSFFEIPWAKPLGSDLMITYQCNFRCSHCNIWQEQKKPELTLAEWQKIIIDLRQWLGPHFPLSIGGGEPFLKPDILAIIEFLVKHDFQVTIETNGYLIDEQLAQKIVNLGISEIRISLYSHAPELHNKTRGIPDAHQRAVEALNFLAEAKNATGSKLRICLGLLVNEEN
ncbi:MAG: radical SAM protein, partial [Candidatus Parcubacteria bacterium]|nr:radical SAM protein [Candidatus Parcubacteria bacterium]